MSEYDFYVDVGVSGLWGRVDESEAATLDETELESDLMDVLQMEFEAAEPYVDLSYSVDVTIEETEVDEND